MPVQERLVISNLGQLGHLFQIWSNILPDSTEYILGEADQLFLPIGHHWRIHSQQQQMTLVRDLVPIIIFVPAAPLAPAVLGYH